jgi:hypothetical protein
MIATGWFISARRRILYLLSSLMTPRFVFDPHAAIAGADKPPVLLLRAFALDRVSQLMQDLLNDEQRFVSVFVGPRGGSFRSEIPTADYRPVLAIGRPGDAEPVLGATRFHVRADMWQKTVEELVPLCALVVWTTGHTRSLHWEIQHLVMTIPPRRLLLWVHVHVGPSQPIWRASEWARVLNMCADVFPKPLPKDAENIDAIAFDDDWTPIPIPFGEGLDRFLQDEHGPLRKFLEARGYYNR